MYNCLKTPTSRFRKLFASLFIFAGLSVCAQAATYWWVGSATGVWNNAANWASTEGGSAGAGIPAAGDEVHIYGNVEVTINSAVSIGQLLISSGTNHLTSNFTTKLSGSGSLTVTDTGDAAINLTRCASDDANDPDAVIGTLAINLPVTCTNGSIQTHSGTTLSVATGKNLSAANLVHSAGNGVPVSKIQIYGTLDLGTGTLNLSGNGNPGANQLVVESGGTVKAGIIEFGQAAYLNTGITKPIINDGTIEVSTSFTIRNFTSGVTLPYDGNGTVKLIAAGATFTNNDNVDISITTLQGTQSSVVSGGGHTSITTATFSAAATVSNTSITTANFNDAITLDGANTFTTFTATGLGGKTLTVNAEQTFQTGGAVTLSGTGTSSLLTVTGNNSGKFTLGSVLTGEYLSLDTDSSVVSASTGTAFAQNSETTGSGTTSWIVTSAGGHLWNGANGSWGTAANWIPQTTPTATDEVIINSGTPQINSPVTVKSITVNGGGVNLQSDSLTLEAITLAASTAVTTASSTSLTISEGCALDNKITGEGTLILASGKTYTIPPATALDINLENNGTLSSTGTVTFSKDFTNNGTASFDGGVTVSKNLTNSSTATFTGGLSVAGNLKDTGTLTGAITFNGATPQTFTPKNVIYSDITVYKSAGTLSVDNSLQVTNLTLTTGAVSIDGNLTLWDGSNYQNYDFSLLANTLTFTGGSSASPRVLRAANITNSSKISADYLKLEAQGTSDITLNSCQNISNLTLETNGGNIAVNGISAESLSIAPGAASVKIKDTINLTSSSQDFIINYPLLLTDDTTFSITKDIKVQGANGSIKSDTSAGKKLSLTANTIQLLNGNALGDSSTGALGTISINSNLTLGANTKFYASQTNFAGTAAKSLSGAYTLSASGNVTDTGAWTWGTDSSLLFNGTNDQTFKTNTNSTYKDITVNKTSGNFIIDTSVINTNSLTITNCTETQFTGVNQIAANGNLSFTKPVTADNNLTISTASGTVTFSDTLNISGDLSVTANTLTFENTVNVKNFTINATTSTSSDITVTGSWTNNKASGGFSATGGTVKLTTISTDASRVTLSGANTFYDLNLDRNVSVLGSNTITHDLIMHRTEGDDPNKGNIFFAANTKQTITGKFDFKGIPTKRLLATCGNATSTTNGTWEIECGSYDIQHVDLSKCKNSSTFTIVIEDPAGTGENGKSQDNGGNINFYFLNYSYTWVGGTASDLNDWNTAKNWSPASIPGKGTNITIPTGKTYYPILTANLDLSYNSTYSGSITVADGAKLDLAAKNLTVGTITNNGLVRLMGASTQTITATMINGNPDTAPSTVEYYGSDASPANTVNFAWDGNTDTTDGKQYKNLIINNTTNSGDNISVSGNLEINAATTLTGTVAVTGTASTSTIKAGNGKTVSLNNSANSFAGTIIAGTSVAPAAIAGALTLDAASQITLANNANADSLTINCPVKLQNVSTSGNQTYNGTVETMTGTAAITSSAGNITFADTLTSSVQTNVSASTGQQIIFNGTVTGIAKLITSGAGTAIFNNTVSSLAELETNAATINCSTLSTTGNHTYNGAVTISKTGGASASSSAGNINFKSSLNVDENLSLSATSTTSPNGKIVFESTSSITGDSTLTVSTGNTDTNSINFAGDVGTPASYLAGLSIGTAKTTSFAKSVYITTLSDIAGSGDITFNKGGTITAATGQTFNTTGTVTFGDSTSTMYIGAATPYKNLTHNNIGETHITGTIYAADITLAVTSLAGSINAANTSIGNASLNGTITTSGSQNFTGTVALAENTNLISNATSGNGISFDSTVNGNKNLHIEAENSNILFTGAVGYTSQVSTIEIPKAQNVTFSSSSNIGTYSVTQCAQNNFTGAVTITTFTDTSNSGSITFAAGGTITAVTGNTFNTSGAVTIGTSGAATPPTLIVNSDVTHNAQTNIYGTLSTPTKNITLGTTGGGDINLNAVNVTLKNSLTPSGNVNITADTFINNSSTATISPVNLNITGNLIIHNGTITINTNITASKDIIILGNTYSETDNTTGITNEYAYNNTRPTGWQSAQYTKTLPAAHNATIQVTGGKIVTAGKNFYANGTSLSGTGSWDLKLPDLTNPANGFAEAYHSVVSNCNVICTDGSSDGSKARLVTLECTEGIANSNQNVDFEDFEITSAFTERDNAIRIEFNRPVRYHSETISKLAFNDTPAGHTFTGLYSKPDCTNAISTSDSFPSYINTTNGNTYYYCYIKATAQDGAASGAWNTDATGKISGASDGKSSDRNGIHHNTKPCLDFPRALSDTPFILTDIWGKRLNNYSQRVSLGASAEPAYGSTTSTHDVADKTGPVLWTVRTGQELHDAYNTATGEASQHSYDAHNFLEFRYSEKVDIDTLTAATAPVENVQVTDSLGAISENITSPATTLTFAGLATITAPAGSTLQLYTGSNGSANKYVNALYRPDEYSIRLSIAGWTDGTITDYTGNEFKKWPGYIEAASQFTGATASAIAVTNTHVTDLASPANPQIEYTHSATHDSRVEPTIRSDTTGSHTADLLPSSPDLYSPWDISEPVFTPLRFSSETDWGDQTMAEAIGNTNGSGSTLDRIDFHFFDNTPTYGADGASDAAEWYTEIGWCTPGSVASKANLLDDTYTYCADIIGGARQFDTDASRRTSGGIRFSTKTGSSTAFRYSTSPNNPSPSTAFQTGIANVHTTVVSQLFTGSSTPMRPANDPDGLYLGLGLTDTNLSVETTFAFSYNDSLGYLTDLAGNRLRSKTSKTIDRTPPSFDVILSPVDTNAVYLIFVKQLVTDSSRIKFRYDNGNNVFQSPYPDFLTLLPRCFRIISIDASGNAIPSSENQIDTSVPAEVVESFSNDSFTCIKLTTTNKINIENLKNLYVQLITPDEYPQTGTDPLTNNTGSRVTLIQDYLGNYMSMYSAHALSDFAINYVNPLYAYSTDMLYEDQSIMNGLYEAGSWAVHDWNADQQNYGTLPAEYPVSIVADTKGNDKIRIYLSAAPDADAVSKQFNSDFKVNFRIWLPALQDGLFRALSASNNTNFDFADGSLTQSASTNSLFNISKDIISKWKSGNQISFMFGLMDNGDNPVRIYNNPYYDVATDRFNLSLSIPVPLYCLRLKDANDLKSLDLWSFKLKGIKSQRGGVTILNNVINASNEEKAVVIVDMPEDGKLTVCIMTLDGNIITYLNRGNTKAGQYYYTWNGKNKAGNSVARGMYFVRVIGGGIDETRKIMVVKDN